MPPIGHYTTGYLRAEPREPSHESQATNTEPQNPSPESQATKTEPQNPSFESQATKTEQQIQKSQARRAEPQNQTTRTKPWELRKTNSAKYWLKLLWKITVPNVFGHHLRSQLIHSPGAIWKLQTPKEGAGQHKYYMDDSKNRPSIALPELTISQKHLHKSLYKYIGKSAWGK